MCYVMFDVNGGECHCSMSAIVTGCVVRPICRDVNVTSRTLDFLKTNYINLTVIGDENFKLIHVLFQLITVARNKHY